jgi:hypothetical protein
MQDETEKSPRDSGDQKDAGLSETLRPVPSQAEGDEQTIDDDLRKKEEHPE